MKKEFSENPILVSSAEEVSQLKENRPGRQKIHFICTECKKDYIGVLANFKDFVCKSCNMKKSAKNVDVNEKNEKRLKTCIKKYGSIENYKATVKEKRIKTCIERFGCEYSFQNEEVKSKIKESLIKNYGSIDAAYKKMNDTREQTLIDKYGVTNVSYISDVIEKRKKTFLEHCKDPMFIEMIRNRFTETAKSHRDVDYEYDKNISEKRKETLMKKYGVDHNFKIPSVIEHRTQYFIETYGTENPAKNELVKSKMRETILKRTPEEWAEINKKRCKKLLYNGILFDSFPEVCLYVFLDDFGIDFQYQPETFFTYEHNGVQHRYFPDFLVGDTFYEIKGDMFFNGDDLVNPWNRSIESDLLNKAKQQCMIDNHIKILKGNDYKVFIDYVVSTKNILREDLLYVE